MLGISAAVPSSGFPALEARSVGEATERAVLSLDLPRDETFGTLYNYVAVDEPAVHLMPLHFLPRPPHGTVEQQSLHTLGVAAKLEYVRSRWVDEIVDQGPTGSSSTVHRLHDALVDLIIARYSEALQDKTLGAFFQSLTRLYARHAFSVAIDGSRARWRAASLSDGDYSAQVEARNGSFRASVDALLLLAGASEELARRARESWHLWVLGAQLYDDALDAEEDFESGQSTWTTARTLAGLRRRGGADHRPDRDGFYEAALTGGALTETLEWAEACFRSSARLAEIEFPSWAAVQHGCITQARRLREDLQELIAETTRG